MLHGMPDRPFVRACLYVLTCALVLAACSGDDDESGTEPKPESKPAALEAAWTAPAPENQTGEGDLYETRDGRILYVRNGTVRAYDAETGKRSWMRSVPRSCSASEPNKAGDIALTVGKECRDVAVIDGRTGKVRWRTHIPTVSPRYDSGDVVASIGDRTVTVIQFCGQVTRLSLRNGKHLGVLAPHDRACANEADSDGQLIALWHDPETADTPDDHGTGWIPSWEGKAAFELYDADTDERLWRRSVNRESARLESGAVVNADPLILALTDDNHATMRKYSRTSPKPGRYVGRQLPHSNGVFDPIGVADGVLVGMYGHSNLAGTGRRLFAYEVETGRELWSRMYPDDLTTAVVGVDEDGVVVTQGDMETDADGESMYRTLVERWDLRTGEDVGLVGRIDEPGRSYGPSVWEVADGTLYAAGSDLRAYELPKPDPDRGLPDDLDWADGDVQPDPLTDACAEIQPATLRQLGLSRSIELPTPADCTWIEHDQPEYSDRGLDVNVTFAEPGTLPEMGSASDGNTAVQNAKALVKASVKQPEGDDFSVHVTSATSHPPMSKPKLLDGVGDEAYASSGAYLPGDGGATAGSYLIVRKRNVVVEVKAEGSYQVLHKGAGAPSLHSSEAGVIAAARDVFTHLGLDITAPQAPPDDGRFKRARGMCSALDDDVAALGLKASQPIMPAGSDPRAAECAWSENAELADELYVHAYAAAPSPLTGETAREVAKRILHISGGKDPRVKGLGDQATIYRSDATWAGDGYANSDRELVVRKGNLVVQVAYSHWGEGVGDEIERDAIRLARGAIRAAR